MVVLPAPFCPTMASDEPAGNREVQVVKDEGRVVARGRRAGRVRERDVAEANLARGCRRPRGDLRSAARRPDASRAPVAALRRRGRPLHQAPN